MQSAEILGKFIVMGLGKESVYQPKYIYKFMGSKFHGPMSS